MTSAPRRRPMRCDLCHVALAVIHQDGYWPDFGACADCWPYWLEQCGTVRLCREEVRFHPVSARCPLDAFKAKNGSVAVTW